MGTWRGGRGVSRAIAAAAAGLVVACNVAASGLGTSPSGADASADGSAPPEDASTPDSTVCPSPAPSASPLTAHRAPGAIHLDGNLDDWKCVPFVTLTQAFAAYAKTPDGGSAPIAADFAVAWDGDYLYVAARVTDATIDGTNATSPELNDSIAIYLGGDAFPTGDYSGLDHQYVVDHVNLAVDYQYLSTPARTPSPPGFLSATQTTDTGFAIEARIGATAVGRNTFAAGDSLGFDFGLVAGDGTTQRFVLLWADADESSCLCVRCCCLSATPLPACDTLRFGKLTLG